VVLVAALIYPLYFGGRLWRDAQGAATLDGLAFLRRQDPDEYGAIAWLNSHTAAEARILEAYGTAESGGGSYSSRTGLATMLEWEDHELTVRGPLPEFKQRRRDIDEIYRTLDAARAAALLRDYGVRYVIVGKQELAMYGAASMAKFATLGAPVYTSPTVTIYRIPA
jgi:uncharacterized membrane protein